MFVARSACVRTFCSNACFGSFSFSMPSSICVYDETPVKGVFTSCATPAASKPIDESFSRCCNCSSRRDARGDIFQHHERAGLSLPVLQRRERDVQNERAVAARGGVKLVDVANLFETPAVFAQHLFERVGEVFRKQILNTPADCRIATQIENVFERGVQTRHASFEIDRQQTQR